MKGIAFVQLVKKVITAYDRYYKANPPKDEEE